MKKGLMSLVAASLLASSAMAVEVSNNGTGDLLIAPYVSVNNNFNTEITLVNTDRSHSYYIRGVFKRGSDSEEVSDIAVVLSPGDTWTGIIKDDGILYTKDDSLWNYEDLKETEETGNPGEVRVASIGENVKNGYFNFYVVFESNNIHNKVDANKPGVSKAQLKTYFNEVLNDNPDVADYISGLDINDDAVMGLVQLTQKDSPTVSGSLPMFALKNAIVGYDENGKKSYKPGAKTNFNDYIKVEDVLSKIQIDKVKAPYKYEEGVETQLITLTNVFDEGSSSDLRNLRFKITDTNEKYVDPCPANSDELYNLIKKAYNSDDNPDNDIANKEISPYVEPECRIRTVNEVEKLEIGRMKTQMVEIRYHLRTDQLKGVSQLSNWMPYNIDPENKYKQGWIEIYNYENAYKTGGQKSKGFNKAVYIPTIINVKYLNSGNDPVLDWYYPSVEYTNK